MSARVPQSTCVFRVRAVRLVLLQCLLLTANVLSPVAAHAAVLPAPPQAYLDTTPVAPTGATLAVVAGQDFQAALNAAQPGDQITLQAGAVFTGPFTLPAKSGSGWITIRTSAPDSSLPPYGTRITPAYAGVLPKIVSSSTSPAIMTAPGAHNYRFVGVEITTGSGITMSYSLISLGDGSSAQNSLTQVPYALTFDRVYVHGNSTLNLQRAFAFNSASTAVVNSYISEIHYAGSDSQAICGWNGPGPFKIVNNYLEASTENILFGGADPSIANLVPSDIEVRGNWVNKPTSWMTSSWTVKNLLELKNARRVLIDGNIFEHNWPQAQTGFAILFTVRDQSGTAPWSIVSDVAFTHNVVRHTANGLNVLGEDDIYTSQQAQRLLVQNNLWDDVSAANWGGNGRLFQVLNAAANLTIDHNTAFQSGDYLLASELPQVAFTFSNNLMPNNLYGLLCDGAVGLPCLSTFLAGAVITNNAVVGGSGLSYPAGNFFPATTSDVGFVDYANGVYQLNASSPYRNAGTDGKDLGVDWTGLTTAVAGVINGIFSAPPPPGPDTTPPTVAIGAPANGATVSGTVTVAASAFDASGIAQVVLRLDGVNAATLTAAPYQASWDTTASANGTHTLSAIATDPAGNQAASAVVTVSVSNTATTAPPTISAVGATAMTASSATIGWATSVPADSQVQYGTTTAYGSTSTLNGTLVSVHAQTLSGLAASTQYHYRVLSHDASGNLATSGDFSFSSAAGSTGAQAGPVTWTSLANVAASSNSLTKTGGCDGCQDAGAVSTQTIASGDGYMEFTYSELTSERAIGLSNGNTDTSIGDIDFGFLLWPGGEVDVREGGVYKADTTGTTGDVFRVSVTGGKISYAKNGTVFYQSAGAPTYPLLVDTSLLGMSSTITNVNLTSGSSSTTPGPGTIPPGTTPAAVVPVVWTSVVRATASGNSLTKTAGCDGCQDAGAASSQTIASGDGYVEFTVSETTTERAIGLSKGNAGTTIAGINFALLLWPGGEIDVREGGTYRADTTAATGDTFRIAVTGGKVTYSKNGTVFYTSAVAPAYPLLVDTSLVSRSSTLSNVMITGGAAPVTWTSAVNVTAAAGSLQKTAGCNGCADAGAVSAQAIASGDGYVEFTVSETTTERAIGLSLGNSDTTIGDIDFALLLWPGGEIDVREGGVYRADTTAAAGDKFRVAVTAGKVTYSKNGVAFYTSATAPQYPLLVDTSMLTASATLSGVVLSGGK